MNKVCTIDVTAQHTAEDLRNRRNELLQNALESHLMGVNVFQTNPEEEPDYENDSGVRMAAHCFHYVFSRIKDLFTILDGAGVDEAEKYVMANKAIAELMQITDDRYPMNYDLMVLPKVGERAKGN